MPRIVIDLDDRVAAAMDRLIADTDPRSPLETAVVGVVEQWLVDAGYLPADELEEGTETEKDD